MSYDLLVIGGGIHGAGIARDAAGRGLSVLLVEKDGLASHTSSASSKLVHGGLRYLEYFHLRLVRESLMERERLLAIAPHLVERRRFVLPYRSRLRPAWAVRLRAAPSASIFVACKFRIPKYCRHGPTAFSYCHAIARAICAM